jgi:ketosteroid isomerase-like protein
VNNIELSSFINNWLEAWTLQDIEKLLLFYSEDMKYIDPNTRGILENREAFRLYAGKLFAAWPRMTWLAKNIFAHADGNGCTVTWRAEITKPDGQVLKLDGMDMVLISGDNIIRNEVYFDRSLLIK